MSRRRSVRSMALVANGGVALAFAAAVASIYGANGAALDRQKTLLDSRLEALAGEWSAGSVPPDGRHLTLVVFDDPSGRGLAEPSRRLGFFKGLSLWLEGRASGGSGPAPSRALAEGLAALEWSVPALLRDKDRMRGRAFLADALDRAGRAGARLQVAARGRGVSEALAALALARHRPRVEKLLVLGVPAARAAREAPRLDPAPEVVSLLSEGEASATGGASTLYLEFQDDESGFRTIVANEYFASLAGRPRATEADVLAGLRELLVPGRSVREVLARAGLVKATLSGRWAGTYFYPEADFKPPRPPVAFEAVLRQSGPAFDGRVEEPNTFGDPSAPVLRAAAVNGMIDPSGNLRFIKVYDGTGGVSHSVEYRGTLAPDGRSAQGNWSLIRKQTGRTATGRFEMRRAPAAPPLRLAPPPATP